MRQMFFECLLDKERRRFRLNIGGAERVEQRCRAGVGAILHRLAHGYYYAADIPAILQAGLEGNGMTERDAAALVDNLFERFPIGDYVVQATAILEAYIRGVDPNLFDAEGNLKPAKGSPETSPAGSVPGHDSA